MDIFEFASKNKLRFPFKGTISTEDLWDLNPAQLNTVYKSLSAAKKTAEEESLLDKPSKEDEALNVRIEIVRYIFNKKQEEAEAHRLKLANDERKRKLRELIAAKEDQALSDQSVDDLKKMLAELE